MAWRVTRAMWIFALSGALVGAVAGCSASVGGAESPEGDDGTVEEGDDGDDGGGDGGGDGGDGVDNCAAEPCDLYEQCGCGAGQACDLDGAALATGGTECRGVTAPGQTQSNCSTDEECAAGYSCLGVPGQCRKFCDEDPDCGVGHCIIQIVYENEAGDLVDVPNGTACTKPCKAESATGSGCPSNPVMGCRFYSIDPNGTPDSGDEYHYTDCNKAAATGGGDAADCSANGDSDCTAGFGCFVITYTDDTTKNECRQICSFNVSGAEGPRDCNVGTCHNFGTPALVGDTEYGVCF